MPGFSAEETPKEFLQSIYTHYQGDPGIAGGLPLATEIQIQRYFSRSMADIIVKDNAAANARGDTPLLDGDPFVGAQEWNIPAFDIQITSETTDSAAATVAFMNEKKKENMHLTLIHEAQGWRISDVDWGGTQGTLHGLYQAH